MAHYKRKKSRSQSSGYYSQNGLKNRLDDLGVAEGDRKRWHKHYPRHWDKVYHTKPARIKTHRLEHEVCSGRRDADDTVWPDGRKPHIYYW